MLVGYIVWTGMCMYIKDLICLATACSELMFSRPFTPLVTADLFFLVNCESKMSLDILSYLCPLFFLKTCFDFKYIGSKMTV